MEGVFGFLRRGKDSPQPEAQDAIHQYSQGQWNDRLREHRKHIRMAWSCAVGSTAVAAIAVVGCIYLGTLPKSYMDYALFDAAGRPIKTDMSDLLTDSERRSVQAMLVKKFIRDIREVYPVSKKRQQDAVFAAMGATNPDTPAWRKGWVFFKEYAPYERMKKEAVTIDFGPLTVQGDNAWTVEFTETVRNNATLIETETVYVGRITTEVRKDRDARKRSPLGVFVWDFDFDAKDGTP